MAKPIKDTPILRGKDAQRFLILSLISSWNRESEQRMRRMKENYEKIRALEKY